MYKILIQKFYLVGSYFMDFCEYFFKRMFILEDFGNSENKL